MNSLRAVLLLLMLSTTVEAKEWRGLIPLKSTKKDVERLLGKPNQFGHYQTDNEKVSVWYSDGPCDSRYDNGKANCECLVAKDTVLRIAVTLEVPIKVSELRIDKTKLERTSIHADTPTSTYADLVEGVVYTVLDSDEKELH